MKIYLDKVNIDNKEILYRLLEYSLFEESLYDKNEMNAKAIFEYDDFDSYFTDDNKKSYFIRNKDNNKLLGFVMINTYMDGDNKIYSITEFMVIPKYRKNKIGKQTAFECFNMYKGIWKVSPSYGSKDAFNFWKNVIDEYTNNNNEYIDGVFIFNNKQLIKRED